MIDVAERKRRTGFMLLILLLAGALIASRGAAKPSPAPSPVGEGSITVAWIG